MIKQIAAIRRKPELTRKEYLDQHYQVYGELSDIPKDLLLKPLKYVQVHVFDSAFPQRKDGPVNSNVLWTGRDDTTELWYRDKPHLMGLFASDFVRTKIAPDALNFSDFETGINLMAFEKHQRLNTRLGSQKKDSLAEGNATVAMLFVACSDGRREGEEIETDLTLALSKALEDHASNDAWGLIINIATVIPDFDVTKLFGGWEMPNYALVYKVLLKEKASAPQFRKAQKAFYKAKADSLDLNACFVLFGQEVVMLDQDRGLPFDLQKQPQFLDLLGASHLD